ncbi:MAG: DUF512 domain-containing protein [candidate division Zixibacteria bacterium]|nr:DUF512 domain-containing protein [candidate division Zixibacteria bacterium]
MKIVSIEKNSPLYKKVSPGAELIRVNGQAASDILDFHFCNTEEILSLEILENGLIQNFTIDGFSDPGLEFEQMKIKVCRNKCLFCFVHQQPKGMRRSLYLKDDDYRFSFTHGNFITLSEMTDADFDRIIAQRLSPMYVSVHATDDKLRRCIFQNEKLEPVLARLQQLTDSGIAIHSQTVVCPGLNDGQHLEKTIEDLSALMPGVQSLAVVPVGLTKFRDRLPQLRSFTTEESREVLDLVKKYQKKFLKQHGTRFVFPADEFFINARVKLPNLSYYEEMFQFENGIGMARQFIVDFNRRKRYLPKKTGKSITVAIVTGKSAESFMKADIMPVFDNISGLNVSLKVVENKFWGENVTVTGLLTGNDIAESVAEINPDCILLPPNCLNGDDLFIDNMSLTEFERRVNCPVLTGTYDLAGLISRAVNFLEVN